MKIKTKIKNIVVIIKIKGTNIFPTKNSDLNFKIACNLRSRTSSAFKSHKVSKTNKTFDLLGCSHSFFKSWILYQLHGNMTEKNDGSVWQIDHAQLLLPSTF